MSFKVNIASGIVQFKTNLYNKTN